MLYDDPVAYVAGLQIYRDFSNPKLYYFLPPEAPRIARVAEGDDYALRLVLFRPDPNAAPPEGMEDGGGFLNLDVDLAVSDAQLDRAKQELAAKFGDDAELVPVPFTKGSVELLLLGVGREDEGKPFVRKVAGSAVPSLYGTQRAAFSVVLDRNGAALMRQVLAEGGLTMALAIYHLEYAAIGPAYNLKITIDYSRVQETMDLALNASLSAGSGNSKFVGKAGFHMLMESLKENRAVVVEEVDPVPGENGQSQVNQERINDIIRNLMGSTWFRPSLNQVSQLTQPQAARSSSSSSSSSSSTTTTTAAPGTTTAAPGTTTAAPGTTTAAPATTRAAARWEETSRTPAGNAFPSDLGVEDLDPSSSGVSETLVFRGTPQSVTAGGRTVEVTNHRASIDVPAGQSIPVVITWPRHEGAVRRIEGRLSRAAASTTATTTAAPGTATTTAAPGTTTTAAPSTGSSDSSVQASFEINFEMIEREEKITASYDLSSRKALKREIHPQGQLAFESDDPMAYIIEADGAIDFFQWLQLEGSTTANWEGDGIDSIQIEIRYGPRGDGDFMRRGEMLLRADQPKGNWKVGVLHDGDDRSKPVVYWYEYRVTVHYRQEMALGDQSGAITSEGAEGADAEGWIRSYSRNLVIHPRDVTPAISVNVLTGVMKYDLLERVQLELSYGPYRQNLALSSDTPQHRMVIRPEPGLEDTKLHTEGTLFYKDGAQVPLPPEDWSAQEMVVINEPRQNMLRVRVIMADPGNEYSRILVRLRYEHGNRLVEQDLELTEHAQLEEWAVRLEDPEQRGWQYQVTLIETGGAVRNIPWTDGEEEQLIVGIGAIDVIPVEVTWLMVPPLGELLAVKIDMTYDDDRLDVHWEHSELIRPGHSGTFTWSIAIRDRELRSYRYRVTEFRATGVTEGEWKESDEKSLVLMPGF